MNCRSRCDRTKADLANGNTDAAKSWWQITGLHISQPWLSTGHAGFDLNNTTQQQQIISKLEPAGVDVTELKADLANGNTDAAKSWLQNYRAAHKPTMAKGTGHTGFDLNNTTQQQQIISKLELQESM